LMVSDVDENLNPQLIAGRLFTDYDLVLVEGYASVPGPKIEVVRAARTQKLRCNEDELLAVASDIADLNITVPLLDLNDTEAVMDHILGWMKSLQQESKDGKKISAHRCEAD